MTRMPFYTLSRKVPNCEESQRSWKASFASIAILLQLLLFHLPVNAQVAGGSITGTVTGESGAVIPDVHISVKDVSSGLARTSTTNSGGLFSVPDLSPGSYEMTVDRKSTRL